MDINNKYASAMRKGNLDEIRNLLGSSDLNSPSESLRGYHLLRKAIECGHYDIVEFLLERGAPINDPEGGEGKVQDSPLTIAIQKEDVSLVEMLLGLGAYVNEFCCARPLHNAVLVGNAEIVKLLLREANVNIRCKVYGSILDTASTSTKSSVDTEIVELLIDKGALLFSRSEIYDEKTNGKKDEGLTQLHMAVHRGYLSVVQHLLKRGTNVNSKGTFNGREGCTPLHLACEKEDDRLVKCLLTFGANVNANAEGSLTPLHVAVGKKRTNLVEILLKHGANVDALDVDHKTALYLAVEVSHLPTVDCVLKYLPNIDIVGNRKSLNAAVRAYDGRCNITRTNKFNIITKLLEYGITVKPRDLDDCRIVRKAIRTELFIIIEDFLKHCVDINAASFREGGCTLLHAACESGSVNIVQRFLDKGAELDATADNGNTPLYQAILWGYKDVVRLLLDRGANIEHRNDDGATALSLTAEEGDSDILEMILRRRPDINSRANKQSIRVAAVNNMFRSVSEYGDIIKSLYRHGFSINPDFLHDSKLLTDAIIKGYLDVVEDFVKYSAKDFLLKCDPLHLAASWMNRDLITLLTGHGFDVNGKNNFGQTPMHCAIRSNVFHHNCSRVCTCDKRCAEIVDLLLQLGANPNVSDNDGKTPLHDATLSIRNGIVIEETTKVLLRQGADVNKWYKRGKIPLNTAYEKDTSPLGTLFLKHAIPNFKGNIQRALLQVACVWRMTLLFEDPLKLGADINSVNENGETTLFYAYKNGYMDLVKKLLEYGCDITEEVVILMDHSKLESSHRDIKDVLKTHITKLIVASLKCSDLALCTLESDTNLFIECCRELETMKNEKVPDCGVLFRDILTDDANKLASFAKNEGLVRFLGSSECQRKFPMFWRVMKGLIWKGVVRRSLLEKSLEGFRSLGGIFCGLPDICILHILSQLDGEDLRLFVAHLK